MSELKLLVIEDNPADVEMLRYGLDYDGADYTLEVLMDGQAALDFVREHRSGKRKPDVCLIVLDMHLPKYSGLEILRAIAESPALTHIRVMAVSGGFNVSEEQEIYRLGASCRRKPMELDEYFELAADLIALCKQSSAAAVA